MISFPAGRGLAAVLLLAFGATAGTAWGVEWPKNYVVMKETLSADGRLGIAVAGRGDPEATLTDKDYERLDNEAGTNYLVDVKKHQVLLKIADADYYERENHRDLTVEWADSGTWGVAYYQERYGISKLLLLHFSDGKWTSFDLTKRMKEEASSEDAPAISYPWLGADSSDTIVHVYSHGNDNPRAFENQETGRGVFEGRYDMVKDQWLSAKAAKISEPDEDLLTYNGRFGEEAGSWHARMDQQLNGIYQRLKEQLNAGRFGEFQAVQREWAAGTGKAGSPAKENVRLAIRLHELRDLLATTLVEAPAGKDEAAAGWPKGYEVEKATISPDGQLGIAVDRSSDQTESVQINYLVNLKERKVLAEIPGVTFIKDARQRGLTADWADDGAWCVVNYGGRLGFSQLILLHRTGELWSVTELGKQVIEAARPVLGATETPLHFWLGADSNGQTLHLYASGNSNPKAPEAAETLCVALDGRYDLAKGEWKSCLAKGISRDDELNLFYQAHADLPGETAEQWQARMDAQLNDVYASLKRHLSPELFEKLQNEEREWSAGAGKAGSPAKEAVRLATRLHEMRDLLARVLVEGS